MTPRLSRAAGLRLLAGAAALAVLAGVPAALLRAEGPAAGAAQPDYTPECAAAVERGLEWLAAHQNKNGSFGNSQVPVATTSMAGIAFLANGNVPGRGRYGEQVRNAVKYLLDCQKYSRQGFITEPAGSGGSRMHGHGYAAMFLAEVLGMTNDSSKGLEVEDLRESVRKAVRVIEESQSKEGGWFYEPKPVGDEGSVTVTQVQALRSARNAGIKVEKSKIDHAVSYIKRSANPDGGIRYSLSSGGNDSSFALTAAGVSVMNYLGEYNMPEIDRGLKYLSAAMEGKGGGGRRNRGSYISYETFYATLAFYHAGSDRWGKYWPMLRDDMLKRQAKDGSWNDSYGLEFGTAFATATLQVPNQYLPIFQK